MTDWALPREENPMMQATKKIMQIRISLNYFGNSNESDELLIFTSKNGDNGLSTFHETLLIQKCFTIFKNI